MFGPGSTHGIAHPPQLSRSDVSSFVVAEVLVGRSVAVVVRFVARLRERGLALAEAALGAHLDARALVPVGRVEETRDLEPERRLVARAVATDRPTHTVDALGRRRARHPLARRIARRRAAPLVRARVHPAHGAGLAERAVAVGAARKAQRDHVRNARPVAAEMRVGRALEEHADRLLLLDHLAIVVTDAVGNTSAHRTPHEPQFSTLT